MLCFTHANTKDLQMDKLKLNKSTLKRAINKAGNKTALAKYLGVSRQFMTQVSYYYGLKEREGAQSRPLSDAHIMAINDLLAS